MLTVCTWLWGNKYKNDDVEKLYAGVKRNLMQPFRFLCVTEDYLDVVLSRGIERHSIPDLGLTKIPGCFARLRMFDPEWQREKRIDDRLVSMDLDSVVTGNLDDLVDRREPFLILRGANASNPCPYNGSIFMLRSGVHPEVWKDFNLVAASKIKRYEFADDQGWLWHMLPDAAGWNVGVESGIYAFKKPGWPKGDALPVDARLVVFPGWRSPAQFKSLPWIEQHWSI